MSGGTIHNLYVLSNASVKGKEASQAIDISATGSSQITALYVARANVVAEDVSYQIIGDVSVNLNYEKQAASYNITALYGLTQNNTEIKGSVSYCFNNANIYQLENLLSKVTKLSGTFNLELTESKVASATSAIVTNSAIDGDVTLLLKQNSQFNNNVVFLEKSMINGNATVDMDNLSYVSGITVNGILQFPKI